MIISIFASIWCQNIGDELILKNEIKMLEEEYWKDTKFIVFSYDYKDPFFEKSNITYRDYFPIWIKKASNFFKNVSNFFSFFSVIWKSDLIVIGWWWIIYDNELQSVKNPLDSWIFRVKTVKFFMKKVRFFAVWLNIKNESNYKKVKQIFSNAWKITVRDNYSSNLLNTLWIESTIVRDPVFNELANIDERSYLLKSVESTVFSCNDLDDIDLEWKKIAIAFRKWYLSDRSSNLSLQLEEWKLNELINFILKKWWEVILLPHSFHKTDDLANDYNFLSKYLRVNEKIRIINSMEEVYKKYIYKEMDICLAMRYHSIVLSQVYWIPYIWVSYSIKTDELLEDIKKTLK